MEAALDYYVKLQADMELEKQTTTTSSDVDDSQSRYSTAAAGAEVELLHQQLPGHAAGSYLGKAQIHTRTSSMDALGFAADYKFKVQKIVARPSNK